MNKATNLTIRIDEELKSKAESLFQDLGLSTSTAIKLFLIQSVNENKIPFEIKKHIPNNETIAAIHESEKMINDTNVKTYNNFDEILIEVLPNA